MFGLFLAEGFDVEAVFVSYGQVASAPELLAANSGLPPLSCAPPASSAWTTTRGARIDYLAKRVSRGTRRT